MTTHMAAVRGRAFIAARFTPAIVAVLMALHASPAAAVVPESWKDALYSYRGAPLPLEKLLSTFAQTMGLRLRLADPTLGHQLGAPASTASSPGQFMDRLASAHRLQWFVYNGELHVSNASSAVTERIRLGALNAASAKQALVGLGLFEQRFGWGELDDSLPVAIVSGPPAYVELVKGVVGKASVGGDADADAPQVMVFRLKHASAVDYEVSVRDRSTSQPGVASSLRTMLADTTGRHGMLSNDFRSPGPIANARAAAADAAAAGPSTPVTPVRRGAFSPSIEAYAPLNAVLVRDLPERRKLYEELIAALDVPSEQIEILVTIVDADVNKLREWSANWSLGGRDGGISVGASAPSDGNSTIVLWALDKLSLRLRALESEGSAQVISRPSVLTLDNTGAVLDMSQSAYFRLIGERTVDLKSVTVGTMLKVTPRIQNTAEGQAIQVTLDIEDGSIQNAGNKNETPLTVRSAISTRATVRPDEALVIGGYRKLQSSSNKSQVPILGSAPIVGALFRSDTGGTQERERLFILTARVVGKQPAAS